MQDQSALWKIEVVTKNLPYLLAGLEMTTLLAVLSMLLGLVLGLVVAAGRLSRFAPLRGLAGLYTDIWRSTPFLAQILWVFYALPILTGYSLTAMTRSQSMRRIVLPQAVTRMLPAIGSQSINLVKESALVSIINLQELMWYAQSLAGFTMRSIEILSAVALIYAALTYPQALLVNYRPSVALCPVARTCRPLYRHLA